MNTPVHEFERTLGKGPYRFIGMFTISLEAGRMGRPYYDERLVHPKFVRGAGTCAHCGHAILNVCQVQIGNGDVFGVGTDCIAKVGLPAHELSKIERAQKDHAKALRDARKAKKGDEARETIKNLITNEAKLSKLPHPNVFHASKGLTLRDYADYVLSHSSHGGVVFALKHIQSLVKS